MQALYSDHGKPSMDLVPAPYQQCRFITKIIWCKLQLGTREKHFQPSSTLDAPGKPLFKPVWSPPQASFDSPGPTILSFRSQLSGICHLLRRQPTRHVDYPRLNLDFPRHANYLPFDLRVAPLPRGVPAKTLHLRSEWPGTPR